MKFNVVIQIFQYRVSKRHDKNILPTEKCSIRVKRFSTKLVEVIVLYIQALIVSESQSFRNLLSYCN